MFGKIAAGRGLLASVPSMMAVSYRVAWALQRQRSLRVLDMLASLAVLLSAALICSSYVALDIFLEIIPPAEGAMLRVVIFVPVSAAVTAVVWRCLQVLVLPSSGSTASHATEKHACSPGAGRVIPP